MTKNHRSFDSAVVGDLRVEELAPQRFESFEGAALIGADQARIARHISREDRRKAAGLSHHGPPWSKNSKIGLNDSAVNASRFSGSRRTTDPADMWVGTQIGTQRPSTGPDWAGPTSTVASAIPQKTLCFETEWDRPGRDCEV